MRIEKMSEPASGSLAPLAPISAPSVKPRQVALALVFGAVDAGSGIEFVQRCALIENSRPWSRVP